MNELLKIELEFDEKLGYYVTSRTIADGLGKRHDSVLRDIDNIMKNSSPQICGLLKESSYKASNGKMNKEYKLTKDGFTLYMFHVQGFTDFKMAYINRFNEMESFIKEAHTKLKEIKIDKKFDWAIKRMRDRVDRVEHIENAIAYLYERLKEEYTKMENDVKFKKDSTTKYFWNFKTDEGYDLSKKPLPILIEAEIEEELAEKINDSKMTNEEILEKVVKILEQKKLTTKE